MKFVFSEEGRKKSRPFPKLMRADSGCLVLFTDTNVGTCLFPGSTINNIGHYSSAWDGERFYDLTGSVTLSNGG